MLTANAMDALVWDVTANDDGTYTFTQNDKTLTLGENNGKFHLNMDAKGTTRWDVETCNAENASYYLSAAASPGSTARFTWNTSPSSPSSPPTAPALTG